MPKFVRIVVDEDHSKEYSRPSSDIGGILEKRGQLSNIPT